MSTGVVCYTHGNKCIFDIGLCIGDTIYARSGRWSPVSIYGGVDFSNWTLTNIKLTFNEWKDLTYEKATDTICHELGINYYQDFEHQNSGASKKVLGKKLKAHCEQKKKDKEYQEDTVQKIIEKGVADGDSMYEIGMKIFKYGQHCRKY